MHRRLKRQYILHLFAHSDVVASHSAVATMVLRCASRNSSVVASIDHNLRWMNLPGVGGVWEQVILRTSMQGSRSKMHGFTGVDLPQLLGKLEERDSSEIRRRSTSVSGYQTSHRFFRTAGLKRIAMDHGSCDGMSNEGIENDGTTMFRSALMSCTGRTGTWSTRCGWHSLKFGWQRFTPLLAPPGNAARCGADTRNSQKIWRCHL